MGPGDRRGQVVRPGRRRGLDHRGRFRRTHAVRLRGHVRDGRAGVGADSGQAGGVGRPGRPAVPRIFRIEVWDLCSRSLTGSAVGAGMVEDRPVVVAGGRRGGVCVWDVDDNRLAARFDVSGEKPSVFALATVDGRSHVVAGGGKRLVLGDPRTGEWNESFTVPGGEISCLTAAEVHGRPIAVTGAEDGTVCVWDLAERRLVGQPLSAHPYDVNGVAVSELEGRPVIISNCRVDAVRVWPLVL